MCATRREVPKAWGHSTTIFIGCSCEVQRIDVVARGYCSRHKHLQRHNLFYVEAGELILHIFGSNADGGVEVVLGAGDQHIVAPNVEHMFENRCATATVAYEIYWDDTIKRMLSTGVLEPMEDIVRYWPGGVGQPIVISSHPISE